MRIALTLIAIAIAWLVWPSTDCDGLTQADCQRAELIAAGVID